MICCDCNESKPDCEFPDEKQRRKMKASRCLDCNRVVRNKMWARRYASSYGRAKWMLMNAKSRALSVGVDFTLTHEWAMERLNAGICEVTGLPFDFSTDRQRVADWAMPYAPSIERRDPSGGYTAENCEIILWMINRARANFDRAVFDEIMRAYVANLAPAQSQKG